MEEVLEYTEWLKCAWAYARAMGLEKERLPKGDEAQEPYRMGVSPATYVDHAYAGLLRREAP